MKKLKDNSNGYVVLLTVLVLEIIVITVTGFILFAGEGASISSTAVKSNIEARAAANGCAQLGLAVIQANTSTSTPLNGSQTLDSVSQETCTYTITGSSPNYTVSASGKVVQNETTFVSNVTVTVSAVSPQLTTSWQYTP